MGIGLPGEGDCVFGHLRYDRLLWRSWKLDELRSSGHWRTSIFHYRNTHKKKNIITSYQWFSLINILSQTVLCLVEATDCAPMKNTGRLSSRKGGVVEEWQSVKCNRQRDCGEFQSKYLWQSTSHSSSTLLWCWKPRTCTYPSPCPVEQQSAFETDFKK